MIHTTAIILAAGRGLRLGLKTPKPLVRIGRDPAIIYSLKTFAAHPGITDIIVAVNRENEPAVLANIRKYRINKIRCIVNGGRRRQDSVANALAVMDQRTQLVLIHDAARPFIDKDTVSLLINSAKKSGAAIPGVRAKATLKVVSKKGFAQKTLDRGSIWEIQTPQVFKKSLIVEAHKRFGAKDATDDAALVERMGKKVAIVEGKYSNIKITTPDDLLLAEVLAKGR